MQLRRFLLTSLFATAACAFAVPAMSTEPYLEFVDGLRKREYFDYAMTYLEQLESRPNLPADIKEVIAYEKAVTLLEEAPTIKNPDQRSKHLDDAKLFLEQFLKSAAPDNPLRAQASTELAQVLVGKCRVEVLQSRSPNNLAQKPQFQTNARAFIGEARKVFQDANDKYEAAYKGYPVYIDKAKDKQIYEAREAALVSYIQAQLNLAIVTYEEAQCYDKTAPEFKQLLTKASEEFEKIHSKYRSQVAGLYARMWQGKCFEEQDDITKALGIYNELLGHPGESSAMRTLQDRVLYFRLICLNHDQRKDYQVVYQDGNDWMKGTPTQKKRSRIGLGIQWEMARGAEGLATKPDTPANEVERWAKIAMAIARTINAYPGEYKEVSAAMIQRLSILLKRDPSDPKDFDTAYGLARNLVNQISKLNEAITTVPPAERKKAQEALALHLDETARILRLGLTLATDKDEIADVNRARYFLSYVYYLMKDRSYDSAILGEFVATRYAEKLPEQALDAAYLAMASYAQAQAAAVAQLNSKATDEERAAAQDEDTERIVRICTFITTHWPTNDKANDARMRLGSLFSRNKKPAEAAKIYAEIPDTAPQYL